jgi:ketosteroid isomerase-like protein
MNLTAWIEGYVRAWNSNDPAEIGALFTDDAEYYTEPYRPPARGREAIVAWWLENRDEPGETSFTWQPLVVADDLAVVTGTTTYPDRVFSNLWVIRLTADGLCRQFTEWWMEHPG